MIGPEDKIVELGDKSALDAQSADELPYFVELWEPERRRVERVLARALTAQLARAIFNTAQKEFPGRRLTLRHGAETLSDSQG
jgi:hypothetical protein